MTSKTEAKVLDDETINFLREKRKDDRLLVKEIELERLDIEFKHTHTERVSNFRTDEIYIDRAQEAEANFIVTIAAEEHRAFVGRQEDEAKEQQNIEEDRSTFGQIMNEMKDLKLKCLQVSIASLYKLISVQNKTAADLRKVQKKSLRERRAAVKERLTRLEARQERERKSLTDAHSREIKRMKYARHIHLRDFEDAELRCMVDGKEFNEKTHAMDQAKTKAMMTEELRQLNLKIFAQLVRNTKEIEQLREIHILKLKHIAKYCDTELDAMDEFESLKAAQVLEEDRLEAELKSIADKEEETLQHAVVEARARELQRKNAYEAGIKAAEAKRDARQVRRVQKKEARERERVFWTEEEQRLREHYEDLGINLTPEQFDLRCNAVLDRSRIEFRKRLEDSDTESGNDTEEELEKLEEQQNRISQLKDEEEKRFARDAFRIETMRKAQIKQVQRLTAANKKAREELRKVQQKALQELMREQEKEEEKLREIQEKEMDALLEAQKNNSDESQQDRQVSDRLSALLPKYAFEGMTQKQSVDPKKFNNLVVLTINIDSLGEISAKVSAKQLVNILNKVYQTFDETVDSFQDLFKLETMNEGYTVVAGLNSQDRDVRLNAIDAVECALGILTATRSMDLSEDSIDSLRVRVGIHTGSGLAVLTHVNGQPKFSVVGEAVSISESLEEGSKANAVKVSDAVYDLVESDYEFDVSESLFVKSETGSSKTKIPTFWLTGRKGKKSVAGRPSSAKATAGSRSAHFSQ
ncbi:Nitrogen permease reactivator protein [Phlyctochytrium bullatum]|nr:Nitrogen permease reactivator protein [Phlyctochytrium bullatum]